MMNVRETGIPLICFLAALLLLVRACWQWSWKGKRKGVRQMLYLCVYGAYSPLMRCCIFTSPRSYFYESYAQCIETTTTMTRSRLQSHKYEVLSTWNRASCRWAGTVSQLKLTLCSHHRSAAPQNASRVWNEHFTYCDFKTCIPP